MGAVAADVVLVLGDVGEMGEIAVGAHDRERLVGVEAVEVASSSRRAPASLWRWKRIEAWRICSTSSIDLLALLLAHGVAEDAAEQADVVAQRHVLLGVVRVVGQDLRRGLEGHGAHPSARK